MPRGIADATLGVAMATMLAAGAATATHAVPAAVPLDVVDRTEHYRLQATDGPGLWREVVERGPQHPTGRRALAYTAWELGARYATRADPDGCRLLDARVRLEVVTTLPDWRPAGPTGGRLRGNWRRMLAHASAHEAEHRRHALDAARAAAVAIAAIAAGPGCAEVERRVRATLRHATGEAERRSRRFDRETDHGRRGRVPLAD